MRNVNWYPARILVLAVSLLLTASERSHAQGNLSNKGKEFWVGYGHHQFMEPGQNNSQEMVLYFSAEQTATVTVTVRGRTAQQVTNYTVPAGSVIPSNYMPKAGSLDCRLYDVPPTFGGNGGEGVFGVSIQIQSNVPIVAYAHTFGSASSGATMLMPVETYGYAYVSVNSRQTYASNCFSWAYVIATQDNTVVEVIPSVQTRLNRPAGVPFTVNLNKGQIYQIIGANPTGGASSLEVSGTKFKSIANAQGDCYPIAAFAGSSRTTNPISCGSGGGDNDNQQLFPIQAWGKKYLTAPTSRSGAANTFMTNSYRVLVKDPTTVVKRNGVILSPATLQQNSFYFFESTTADVIEADKPVMVAQFMTGGACLGNGLGDPEMIFISPVEQGIKRVGFYRNTRESISVNYLTMIIPTNGVASLRIDGSATFDHSYVHPQDSRYTIVVKRWTASQSQAIVFSDSAFTAITYGLGSVESYGYNAGTLINNLSALSEIQNTPDPTTPFHFYTCQGTSAKLSVLMAYQPTKLEILMSTLGASITPNTDVILNNPVPASTTSVNGVPYYKYELPGTYVFNAVDTFDIPVKAYHPTIENCYNREDLSFAIIVKAKPKADFTYTHSGCTLDAVNFTGSSPTPNGYNVQTFNWTFPGGATATGQSQIRTLPPGINDVRLSVVTADGCASDTLKQITVYDRPPAEFKVTPNQLCVGTSFTITDTSSASVTVNSWYWDFGNGITQTVTTGPTVTYTYPAAGTYIIKHVTKSSATCISDTITRTVTVYHKPTVNFTNDASGCLSPAGIVQFTGTASTPDGQTFAAYNWNFGDPNASGGNPNTSSLQNPSHGFQQGAYVIKFWATTANGCVDTSIQNITFNLKPALTYPALNAVCENATAFSIATANVTNGVTGTGVYSGPGTAANGQFNPAIAGYGTHTIKYVFTSGAGCADSITQNILVHARPRTNFTLPAAGCLATTGLVQFTNATSVPDAQVTSWLWTFGDPNANGSNPNTSTLLDPTHNYLEGTYSIKLEATTSNGCVKDTTIQATFKVTPALTYAALNPVCQNVAAFSIASATVTNGVTGTGVYSGPGTSANGQFDPGVAGPGTHTITYTFTSTGGCVATTTSTIQVYTRPTSTFNLSGSGNLCLGQDVTISSTATVFSGSITTWNWNLGNGQTPSNTNGNPFTVNYTPAGSYTVQLTTISNNGCISLPTTQSVNVNALPVADFALPTTAVCMPGGSVAFTNQSTIPGNTVLTYQWSFGDGNNSTQTSPTHIYNAIGSYPVTLVATSTAGCVHQITKTMSNFVRKPAAQFRVDPTELCQGADNQFTDQSAAFNGTLQNWNWNFGDGTTATVASPIKKFLLPGNYNVTLTVTNTAGCVSDPFVSPVIVHLQPVIDAGINYVLQQGTQVTLQATANSSTLNFLWTPSIGLSDPTILKPVLTAVQDQTYVLTAIGDFGCRATDQMTVKILKLVTVPNVFSPNGDGIHDVWSIPNLADYPGSTVEVFNRYGQQILYSQGYTTPWNGTRNGQALPAGTYYYIIQLKNGFKPLSGSVTILR